MYAIFIWKHNFDEPYSVCWTLCIMLTFFTLVVCSCMFLLLHLAAIALQLGILSTINNSEWENFYSSCGFSINCRSFPTNFQKFFTTHKEACGLWLPDLCNSICQEISTRFIAKKLTKMYHLRILENSTCFWQH